MFSITTPTQIKDNPLNTSTSKNHWSFSKAARFKDPNPNCKTISYQTKPTLSARKASIGWGNRSAYFEGRRDTVDPGNYNLTSSFQYKKGGGYAAKGHNFGYNRDQLNFSNYLIFSEKTPGPAKYQNNQSQIRGKKAYSMRPKTSYPKNYFLFSDPQASRISKDPGPGKYQTIDSFGSKYINSKSKNNGNSSFIHDQRFYKQKRTPGPGDYKIQHSIEPDGRCLLSNMRCSGRRAIMSQKRELKLQGNKYTPGPGSYRHPSDFGHYQSNGRPQTARR